MQLQLLCILGSAATACCRPVSAETIVFTVIEQILHNIAYPHTTGHLTLDACILQWFSWREDEEVLKV